MPRKKSRGLQPGDPVVVTGEMADGPRTMHGTVDWFDNELATDGALANQGDPDAMDRVLSRMEAHAPGITRALATSNPGDGTRIVACPGSDPKYRQGYDAIFGRKGGKK